MNKIVVSLLLLALISINSVQAKLLRNSKIIYAIDIGNTKPYESQEGIEYSEDRFFDSHSRIADYAGDPNYNSKPVKFTEDIGLYFTERHADSDWGYSLPFAGLDDGMYVLIVRFCELYFTEPGRRKTNVRIGDTKVLEGVDIVEKVGPFAALDEFIEFELRNDQVYINDELLQNGITRQGELRIVFERTQFDLPKVDGLVIIKGTLQDSYKKEYEKTKAEWQDRMQHSERMKEQENQKREKARSILQDEFDAELDTEAHLGFVQGVQLLMQEPAGIIIIVVLVLFFVCLKLTEEKPIKKSEYTKEQLSEKKKN